MNKRERIKLFKHVFGYLEGQVQRRADELDHRVSLLRTDPELWWYMNGRDCFWDVASGVPLQMAKYAGPYRKGTYGKPQGDNHPWATKRTGAKR